MTARDFHRQRWALRRQTRFIPIALFGFDEFEPIQSPRPSPQCPVVPAGQPARPTAREEVNSPPSSPAFSDP